MKRETIESISRRVVACTRCPELRAYCAQVAEEKRRAYRDEPYWGKPVPAFGDANARLMLIGLAPGAHGSNRTGRAFTGDASGDFLYPALYRAGFANRAESFARDDGLELHDCIITAAGRCAPPANKPTPQQLRNCFSYLLEEFDALLSLRVIVGLGATGTTAALKILKARDFIPAKHAFAHGAETTARNGARAITLLSSYHPSRQNTNTGVLTARMFDAIFMRARELLNQV